MTKCKFIGGPLDGQTKAIAQPTKHLRIPMFSNPMAVFHDKYAGRSQIEYVTYSRLLLGGDDEDCCIYAIDDMSADDVILALIDGYRPNLRPAES